MTKFALFFILLGSSFSQAGGSSASLTATVESSLMFSMLGTFSPTILSDCAIFQDCQSLKIVVESKEDAALFVATDGKIKGVRFALALETLRSKLAFHLIGVSDMELAQAILAL